MNINKIVRQACNRDLDIFNRVSKALWPDMEPVTITPEQRNTLEIKSINQLIDVLQYELIKREVR